MSSGYKIKGHQRSRSAKPYERKTVSIYKSEQVRRRVCGVSRVYFHPIV